MYARMIEQSRALSRPAIKIKRVHSVAKVLKYREKRKNKIYSRKFVFTRMIMAIYNTDVNVRERFNTEYNIIHCVKIEE